MEKGLKMELKHQWTVMDGKELKLKVFKLFPNDAFSVCACGKWICTSEKCSEKHTFNSKPISNNLEDPIDEEEYDEDYYEDDDDYEDYPEDDPDVQDINWF